jgi:hypothetical protein
MIEYVEQPKPESRRPGLLTVQLDLPLSKPRTFRTDHGAPNGTPWWKPWARSFHQVDYCLPESQVGIGNWFSVRLVWRS